MSSCISREEIREAEAEGGFWGEDDEKMSEIEGITRLAP